MRPVAVATALAWLLSIWCALRVFQPGGFGARLQRFVAAGAFALIGVCLGSVLLIVQLFHAFTGETFIARVTARKLSPQEFELTYAPAPAAGWGRPGPTMGGGAAVVRRIRLRGDQWSVSGGIVKWHPWLTSLGLSTYHKPIWVSGQFSRLEQQRTTVPTVYALEPDGDRLWDLLYTLDPYLPFIDAVYGSSAYVYVEPGVIQEIFVTSAGYLIRRVGKNASSASN